MADFALKVRAGAVTNLGATRLPTLHPSCQSSEARPDVGCCTPHTTAHTCAAHACSPGPMSIIQIAGASHVGGPFLVVFWRMPVTLLA